MFGPTAIYWEGTLVGATAAWLADSRSQKLLMGDGWWLRSAAARAWTRAILELQAWVAPNARPAAAAYKLAAARERQLTSMKKADTASSMSDAAMRPRHDMRRSRALQHARPRASPTRRPILQALAISDAKPNAARAGAAHCGAMWRCFSH
eukprot:IDg12283t1